MIYVLRRASMLFSSEHAPHEKAFKVKTWRKDGRGVRYERVEWRIKLNGLGGLLAFIHEVGDVIIQPGAGGPDHIIIYDDYME